jgi:hypothetical protein
MMCEELTGVRRAVRSTAVLSARQHAGFNGASSAQCHEHVAVLRYYYLREMLRSRAGNLGEFRI